MMRERQAYWLRAVGLWMLLMMAETMHGLWRVKVLGPWIGDQFAHEIAIFTGSLIVLLIVFACIDWIPSHDPRTLLIVGGTWVILTICYEVVLGRYAFNYSWERIVAEFDFAQGRLLPLGLILLLISPFLAARARGRIGDSTRPTTSSQL